MAFANPHASEGNATRFGLSVIVQPKRAIHRTALSGTVEIGSHALRRRHRKMYSYEHYPQSIDWARASSASTQSKTMGRLNRPLQILSPSS
jgi:hypothetical protein